MLQKTALPEDQIQAILAANKSERTERNEMPRNGKNEMQRNNDYNDEDKELKGAKIAPLKRWNLRGETLTSNSFAIKKRETRSMKQPDKNKIPEIAKITPHSKKPQTTNDDNKETESVDALGSGDVSDILNTPLTLKRNSSEDVIFSTKDAIFSNSKDVIFNKNAKHRGCYF